MKALLVIALILNQFLLYLLNKTKEESKSWEMLANHTAYELEKAESELVRLKNEHTN